MSGYAVEPVQLQHGDASLRAAAAHSRAALAELRTNADAVLDAWHGAAANAFRLGWQHWLAGALAMLDSLDEMATALGASGAGYATTDEAVRTSLSAGHR